MNNPFNNLELPQFEPDPAGEAKPRPRGRPPRAETVEPIEPKSPRQVTVEPNDLDIFAAILMIWNKLPADQRARIHTALGKLL